MVEEAHIPRETGAIPSQPRSVLKRTKDILPLTVSVLALIVSGVSVYYTTLRPSHLTVVAGSPIHLSHGHLGQAAIRLPISFSNAGAQLATVRRVVLVVRVAGATRGYLVAPHAYERLTDKGEFSYESLPLPITLAGGERVSKQVLFWSSQENPDDFVLTKPGKYEVVLLAWLFDTKVPKPMDSFRFELSELDADKLDHFRLVTTKQEVAVEQASWSPWGSRALSEEETTGWFRHDN